MDLDWVTLGVFLLSFLLCAALVGVVSLLGAQEKTFEEALEEQKRKKLVESEKNQSRAAKKRGEAANTANKRTAHKKKNPDSKVGEIM